MSEFSPICGGNEGYGAGDDVKRDKEQASSVALCSVTSARSAGSYGSFRGVPKWVKIERVISLLRSSPPRAYSRKKKVGVMPRKICYREKKVSSALPNARTEDAFLGRRTPSKIASQNKE